MARYEIDIDFPLERMEETQRRSEARARYEYADRVPVNYCIVPRFFAPRHALPYHEYFRDAETQFVYQLKFAKDLCENIPGDFQSEPVIYVHPYFDNAVTSSAFGCDVHFPENETVTCTPVLRSPGDVEKLTLPDLSSGLWGVTQRWWNEMREMAADTRVTFAGRPGRVEVAGLSLNMLSPHMVAIDLVGTDFYWWMLECPEICHKLLLLIERGMELSEAHARRLDPRRGERHMGVAEDSSPIMSQDMFREFVVPYDKMLYNRFPGERGMHICGNFTHLVDALIDDLRITSMSVFGYCVDDQIVKRRMGGRCQLWGNIDPMLMLRGTREQVYAAAMRALSIYAPCGGYTLGDGANICPGTPIQNIAALVKAAEDYGKPELDPEYANRARNIDTAVV